MNSQKSSPTERLLEEGYLLAIVSNLGNCSTSLSIENSDWSQHWQFECKKFLLRHAREYRSGTFSHCCRVGATGGEVPTEHKRKMKKSCMSGGVEYNMRGRKTDLEERRWSSERENSCWRFLERRRWCHCIGPRTSQQTSTGPLARQLKNQAATLHGGRRAFCEKKNFVFTSNKIENYIRRECNYHERS